MDRSYWILRTREEFGKGMEVPPGNLPDLAALALGGSAREPTMEGEIAPLPELMAPATASETQTLVQSQEDLRPGGDRLGDSISSAQGLVAGHCGKAHRIIGVAAELGVRAVALTVAWPSQ